MGLFCIRDFSHIAEAQVLLRGFLDLHFSSIKKSGAGSRRGAERRHCGAGREGNAEKSAEAKGLTGFLCNMSRLYVGFI